MFTPAPWPGRGSIRKEAAPKRECPIRRQPPILPLTIPFAIPAYWTSEQALAVYELLDDLREQIWAHYQLQLMELFHGQHLTDSADHPEINPDDLPF